MKDSKKNSSVIKILIIIVTIVSIINVAVVMGNEITTNNKQNSSISDCRGLSYNGKNAEKEKQKCLNEINKAKEQATKSEEYLNENKQMHKMMAIVLETISAMLIITIVARRNSSKVYIILIAISLLINLFMML